MAHPTVKTQRNYNTDLNLQDHNKEGGGQNMSQHMKRRKN